MEEKYKEEEDGFTKDKEGDDGRKIQRGRRWSAKDKQRDDGRKIQREEDRVQRIKRKNLWYKEKADGQSRTTGKKREIKVASVENQELTQ